jgi:hypothetical protein
MGMTADLCFIGRRRKNMVGAGMADGQGVGGSERGGQAKSCGRSGRSERRKHEKPLVNFGGQAARLRLQECDAERNLASGSRGRAVTIRLPKKPAKWVFSKEDPFRRRRLRTRCDLGCARGGLCRFARKRQWLVGGRDAAHHFSDHHKRVEVFQSLARKSSD